MKEDISPESLSRQDTVLGMVLNTLFDGVYIVDKTRRIVFWNSGAEAITGYTAEEVSGRRCSDDILNHIDENGTLLCKGACPLVRTLRTGQHVREKIYPLHKSGRRFPVMAHIAPIKDQSGEIVAAIEVFRDISKKEEFRILQEKFNDLIRRYVSSATFEDVMERIHSDSESTSRLRDLTILYLDIVGFTPYSERYSPEEVVEMLNDVFGICEMITKECNGDIDKFIGDSVMAVFVDANDAVAAGARILYDALPNLNRARVKEGKNLVNVRIGINSGSVIQGDIGSIERKDLTVIGDAVNTASRIETVTPPNSISISEATFSRLRNPELFRFDREVMVKGKKQPIRIFRYFKKPHEGNPG